VSSRSADEAISDGSCSVAITPTLLLIKSVGLTRFAGVVCPGDGALTTTIVRTSTVVDHPSVASYSL
jgi:hypothetical protein